MKKLWRKYCQDEVFHFVVKFWIWRVATPAAIAVAFFAPGIWKAISILWLAYVSHAAMVATHRGNIQAAKAAQEAKKRK